MRAPASVPNVPNASGVNTPMRFEAVVEECIVDGEVPADLNGGYYINGTTWQRPTLQGTNAFKSRNGMVQAYIFKEGKVSYRNRFTRTPKYLLEERLGRSVFEYHDAFGDWRDTCVLPKRGNRLTDGVPEGGASTNTFPWYSSTGGSILTANEQSIVPVELDPLTLETKGLVFWSNQLSPGISGTPAFTAHPKWDHDSGEVFGWTIRSEKPYVTLHFVQPDGSVKTRPMDDAPHACAVHDGWLTPEFLVLPFTPLYTSHDRPLKQQLPTYGWDPTLPSCVALVPRSLEGQIRYIYTDFPPEYCLHTVGAHQADDKIYLEGPIYDRAPYPTDPDQLPKGAAHPPIPAAVYGRWIVDLRSGKIRSERIGNIACEFPKMDERYYGKNFQNGFYLAGGGGNLFAFDTVVHRNVVTGEERSWTYEHDTPLAIVEPTFAPRSYGSPEGDGYLLAPVILHGDRLGELLIFDTADIARGPVAVVKLPFQTGWISHGHYMDFNHARRLAGQ